eukprot:augustus_masked-scaffold_2-processed-gene-18.12-mRNA-1 protein AED:0.05 eAED:0.05 QI:0/-1/0/1/-1/1/1/0/742
MPVAMAWAQPATVSRNAFESGLEKRKLHSSVLVGSNVYIFGGYNGEKNLNSIAIYDTIHKTTYNLNDVDMHRDEVTGKFRLPDPRNGHASCIGGAGYKDCFFIHAGWTKNNQTSDDLWMFNTKTREWLEVETYSASLDQGEFTDPDIEDINMPGLCNLHSLDFFPTRNSLILFKGGDGRNYFNDLYELHLDTMVWEKVQIGAGGRVPTQRANHASCVAGKNKDALYIFGGWNGTDMLNDLHSIILSPDKSNYTWRTFQPEGYAHLPPSPRCAMRMVNYDAENMNSEGKLLLFGGKNADKEMLSDLYVYDCNEGLWNKGAHLEKKLKTDSKANTGGSRLQTVPRPEQRLRRRNFNRLENNINRRFNMQILAAEEAHNRASEDAHLEGMEALPRYLFYPPVNPNEGPEAKDLEIKNYIWAFNKAPEPRYSYSATLVGRKIVFFGGASDTKKRIPTNIAQDKKEQIFADLFELEVDPPPPVLVMAPTVSSLFVQKLKRYFPSSEKTALTDVCFRIDNQKLFAHKLVLVIASDIFKAQFDSSGSMKDESFKDESVINIDFASYEGFKTFLEYLYSGDIPNVISELLESRSESRKAVEKNVQRISLEAGENVEVELEEEVSDSGNSSESENGAADLATLGYFQGGIKSADHQHIRLVQGSELPYWIRRKVGDVSFRKEEVTHINLILELLVLSDRYILDHLKQVCESALVRVVHFDLVDHLIQVAQQANADQLLRICKHFKKHSIQG